MCILLVAYKQHPEYPLVIAANREEAYARPTRAASFWDDAPQVLAGRDLLQGGTWLGITRQGRLAALTNFRDPGANDPQRPSRGHLVSDYLRSDQSPASYLQTIALRAADYNGFSLVVGLGDDLRCYSNREPRARVLVPGLYGLSNHLLDTPWPKLVRGKQALRALLTQNAAPLPQALFEILSDRSWADDTELPDTGLGRERERLLSPLFVSATDYGTRSSTVVLVDHRDEVIFVERTFDRTPERYTQVTHRLRLDVQARTVRAAVARDSHD